MFNDSTELLKLYWKDDQNVKGRRFALGSLAMANGITTVFAIYMSYPVITSFSQTFFCFRCV